MQINEMKKMINMRAVARACSIAFWYSPIVYCLIRVIYVWIQIFQSCPEGVWPLFRFVSVAGIVTFGPGLWLNRFLHIRCRQFSTRLLLIMTTSLSASAIFCWYLYFFGIYTLPILLIGLSVMTAGGIYGFLNYKPTRWPREIHMRWCALPTLDRIGIILGLLILEGLFESSIGAPMTSWDALVSWDKWAVDMALRRGLGQYIMGGYPQFMPTLHSIFYKIAGSGGETLPLEHLLLHGFCTIYVAWLFLSLRCIGRSIRVPSLAILILFIWNRDVFAYLTNGYVDIPLTAAVSAAMALIFLYNGDGWKAKSGRVPDGIIFTLAFFAVAFLKGNGLIWVCLLTILLTALLWKQQRPTVACISVTLAILSVTPYYLHQLYYTHHSNMAERSPFLHAFTLQLAHTSLVTPNAEHARVLIEQLMQAYGVSGRMALGVWSVCVFLCLWGLWRRKFTFCTLSGALLLAIWFYTGSYDFRNAFVPLLVLTISIVGILFDFHFGRLGNRLQYVLFVAMFGAGLFYPQGSQLCHTLTQPFRRYSVPPIIAMQPGYRHMAVRPWGDIRNLFATSPYGQRATHLWSGTGLYRLLGPRGAYALNFNSYLEARPHDLVVQEDFMKTPDGFVPVARLRRTGGKQSLCVFAPEFHPVTVDLEAVEPANEIFTWSNAVLRANHCYQCHITAIDLGIKQAVPRDGVIAIQVYPDGGDVNLILVPEDAKRDPYAPYFASNRDGSWVRLLYWMRDDGPAYPRFMMQIGMQDVHLMSIEWGQ